jgi:ABC-type lipoprotein release transport system permease subunit
VIAVPVINLSIYFYSAIFIAIVFVLFLLGGSRNKTLFKLALRSFKKHKKRTALIIVGLFISSTMISSSFIIGDTAHTVINSTIYSYYGYNDISIYSSNGYSFFNYSIFKSIYQNYSNNPQIETINPLIYTSNGSAYDLTNKIPQTQINIFGLPFTNRTLTSFTYLKWYNNSSNLPSVYMDLILASTLGASPGNKIALIIPRIGYKLFILRAIVSDNYAGGVMNGDNAFISLGSAQNLTSRQDQINEIVVTMTGGIGGKPGSISLSNRMNATLAEINAFYKTDLSANPLKEEALTSTASLTGQIITLFMVLGLSSVLTGLLLIGIIFITMAEEREQEMGIMRAIGMKKRDLIKMFVMEGVLYALIAAVVGTFVGIPVSYVMIEDLVKIFSSALNVIAPSSITIVPAHLFVSILTGFTLSVLTITIASWRISNISIINAIKGTHIIEKSKKQSIITYIWYALFFIASCTALITGIDTKYLEIITLGITMLSLFMAMTVYKITRNGVVFAVLGIFYLYFWGYPDLFNNLFPKYRALNSSYMFFESGIFLITAIIFIILPNIKQIISAIARLIKSGKRLSILLLSFSYISNNRSRTSLSVAMFAFVTFSVLISAMFGAMVNSGVTSHINNITGGYNMFLASPVEIKNFTYDSYNNTTIRSGTDLFAPFMNMMVSVNVDHSNRSMSDTLFAPLDPYPFTGNFFSDNKYTFSRYSDNFKTPSSVWNALNDNPHYAIVTALPSIPLNSIIIINRNYSVKIIGIINTPAFSNTIFISNRSFNVIRSFNGRSSSVYTTALLRVNSAQIDQLSFIFKKIFVNDSLVVYNINALISQFTTVNAEFFQLIEIYMYTGLVVSIAGLGIIVFREVIKRKQEIGMLRSMGMTEKEILKVLLMEISFTSITGILIGEAASLILSYDISYNNSILEYVIPWITILEITIITYIIIILVTLLPAYKASKTAIAEAVKYTE